MCDLGDCHLTSGSQLFSFTNCRLSYGPSLHHKQCSARLKWSNMYKKGGLRTKWCSSVFTAEWSVNWDRTTKRAQVSSAGSFLGRQCMREQRQGPSLNLSELQNPSSSEKINNFSACLVSCRENFKWNLWNLWKRLVQCMSSNSWYVFCEFHLGGSLLHQTVSCVRAKRYIYLRSWVYHIAWQFNKNLTTIYKMR